MMEAVQDVSASLRGGAPDIAPARLDADQYVAHFADVELPLDDKRAVIEANRCFYCFDAPCIEACPTSIDIPSFIHKIATGNVKGAAVDILSQNIFGGACARVCPTEILCEQSCVRNRIGDQPVDIGALQRYATDPVIEGGAPLFERAAATGRRVAVVGAGPAGLACAHRLSLLGHEVTVFEARPKAGGLNEYGIAAYKLVDDFAAREVAWIIGQGGISLEYGKRLGSNLSLDELKAGFDAVFLGVGLGGTNRLGLPGEELAGIVDAVSYIAELRQSDDLSRLPVGRRVVVIGGGNTAIDIAIQSKRLGADEVTLVYRRGAEQMSATDHEQDFARTNGVVIRHWARPVELIGADGALRGVRFERTALDDHGRLTGTNDGFTLAADVLFKAIGQTLTDGAALPAQSGGKITVDADFMTSQPGVFAGGDCISSGVDLTVQSVADGRDAALAIDRWLKTR